MRLRQLGDRFGITQPEIRTRQRLPGLGKHVAYQRPAQGLRPLGDQLAFGGAHAPGDNHAALLPPEEPVALLRALKVRLLAQPRFFTLPPVTERLLPVKTRVVQLAVQRLGKRAVDMQRPAAQRFHGVIDGGDQPACRNILGGPGQRNRLRRMRRKESRLTDGLIGAAVDKLRGTIGRQQNQLFTG